MMTRHFLILFILLICACTTPPTEALPPTATTVRVVAATLVPTLDRHAQALPTASPLPTFTPRPENCPPVTGQSAAQHSVVANLNYVERGLAVAQTTRYSNRTNENLTDLVFTIEANGWPGAFTLDTLELDGADVTYELTGRRLHIELPQALLPGCFVTVAARFRLIVPEIGGGISGYRGFLGHSPRQLNLGNWLLAVAPHLDGEWITREAVLIGEQTVFDAADWDVTVNVNGAVENLQIAAPGTADRSGERSWHFNLERSRDFTLSISDQFNVLREETSGGVTVEVYSFDDARIAAEGGVVVDAAAYALEVAINSVSRYSDLYGAYPYRRLVVVQGDFPDGMEFSGLVFVSRDWFTRFTGNPASYLMLITAHEIAHQWWYAAVGSDQAQYPWLDEALATYSEYVFIEEYYPELRDWWWSFRVDAYTPQGFVDSTVYQFSSIREYINAVYLLGAHMLHDLRRDLGTDAFFDLLRRYAEAGTGRIVTPEEFWSLLTPEQLEAVQAT
ncbi:MAG: M1 family metallopeptidase, partial [Anaerolineae bacterium]|nr:M1 family metallopeptidase [Anaerolineae bacterium]